MAAALAAVGTRRRAARRPGPRSLNRGRRYAFGYPARTRPGPPSIDASTVQVLKEHRARQAAEQLAVGTGWRGTDDYVLNTGWGEPVHPDTVSSLMADLIRSHNEAHDQAAELLPHARLHDLRHIHATTLLLAEVPVHVVAARLGHADPSITPRVYAHVMAQDTRYRGDHVTLRLPPKGAGSLKLTLGVVGGRI